MKVAAEEPASALEGALLSGRYKLRERLGKGGMAYVYRAEDSLLGRDVAIKVLSEVSALNGTATERFAREGRILASIDSPYVVPLYDVGADGPHTFLVMKLLNAPGLDHHIKTQAPVSPSRAVHLVSQVLDGLETLNRRNLVHRDVKPANILVDDDDNAMLLDLGITFDPKASGLTGDGIILGTPSYISPEQVAGHGIDGRSDLYSVGIVLFELLTGRRPFLGKRRVEICLQHLKEAPPAPKSLVQDIPASLNDVVMKALAKDPNQRYQSAEAMILALRQSLAPHALAPEPKSGFLSGKKERRAPNPPLDSSQIMENMTTSRMRRPNSISPSNRALYVLASLLLMAVFIQVVVALFG